jgi:hypothetical protein
MREPANAPREEARLSRADFKRGWDCAVAEVARKLRDGPTWAMATEAVDEKLRTGDGAGLVGLIREEAACVAENVIPNVGIQRSELTAGERAALTSDVGLRATDASDAAKLNRAVAGEQVTQSPTRFGVFKITARGRSELID